MSNALRLSVAEYDQIAERGAFDDLGRGVELLFGEICQMNPAGPVHDDIIEYLNHWSMQNTDPELVRVRIQSGLKIAELDSRPEPDVVWIRKGNYRHSHPTAADVWLLIEVSESSLETDRSTKVELYSKAGIREYWIVDARNSVIHVNRDPTFTGYQSMESFAVGDTIAPQAFPGIKLGLSDLFT